MSWPTRVAVGLSASRRGRVRLVGGVDEVVGADVARDLGHGAADPEPDGADGGQDEGELGHARPARARRAEQVGHGEEDRQRAQAVEDGARRSGTTGCWPTSIAKAEMRPGGMGWPAAVRPIASTTVTILSSNSLDAGWPRVVRSTPRIVSTAAASAAMPARWRCAASQARTSSGVIASAPGPTRRCAGSGLTARGGAGASSASRSTARESRSPAASSRSRNGAATRRPASMRPRQASWVGVGGATGADCMDRVPAGFPWRSARS